jgi:hypothetical protein
MPDARERLRTLREAAQIVADALDAEVARMALKCADLRDVRRRPQVGRLGVGSHWRG